VTEPTDAERFPAPAYTDAVLAPLFELVKRHHWRNLMRVDRAHAVMLAERGILSSAHAAAIPTALEEIEADIGARIGTLHYGGAHEDFFFFVADELRRRLGVGVAGRLHTGRSRNDVDQTILKMGLKERLLGLGESVLHLIGALMAQANWHRDTLVVAYTHGQPAQPTTWGHYLGAMIEVLVRDAHRILRGYVTVDQCSMGAAAITTTGFPIDRARVAALLGFARVQENSYGAIAACDYVTEAYAAIKVMLINIGRFVQDLGQWTGFEVGHLRVPDGFVQRSSIMPQKRNPVPIEHLRLLSSIGIGHCDAVAMAMHNTPFTDMNDNEYTVHETGYAAIDTAQGVVQLLQAFVAALRIDEGAVRRHIDASSITMTELADSLVREESIAFAEAHEICSRLARLMVVEASTLATVPYDAFAAAFTEVMRRAPSLGDQAFRRCTTPEHFIAVRTIPGGPAPAPLARMLAGYHDQAESLREAWAAHRHRLDTATITLAGTVAKLRVAGSEGATRPSPAS
jgi:argininosuccinate lyase